MFSRKSNRSRSSTPEALRELGEVIAELRSLETNLAACADVANSEHVVKTLEDVEDLLRQMDRAWSGSWLGYQSRVYMKDFAPKGPDDFFDADWGMEHPTPWHGHRGNWVLVDAHKVRANILQNEDVVSVFDLSMEAEETFDEVKTEVITIADALLSLTSDDKIRDIRAAIAGISSHISASDFIKYMMPKRYATHDIRAMQEGPQTPPHKDIAARIHSAQSRWNALISLKKQIILLTKYLERRLRLANADIGSILSTPDSGMTPPTSAGIQAGGDITIVNESGGANTISGKVRLSDQAQLLQGVSGARADENSSIDRDVFERDVAEILSLLIDAKEELESNYEGVRAALRKLNLVQVEHGEQLSSLRAKLDTMLTEDDKLALRNFSGTASSVGVNIVSSGLWTYVVEPVLRSL